MIGREWGKAFALVGAWAGLILLASILFSAAGAFWFAVWVTLAFSVALAFVAGAGPE